MRKLCAVKAHHLKNFWLEFLMHGNFSAWYCCQKRSETLKFCLSFFALKNSYRLLWSFEISISNDEWMHLQYHAILTRKNSSYDTLCGAMSMGHFSLLRFLTALHFIYFIYQFVCVLVLFGHDMFMASSSKKNHRFKIYAVTFNFVQNYATKAYCVIVILFHCLCTPFLLIKYR